MNSEEPEVLTPVQAAEIYEQCEDDFAFRMFCPSCGGWVEWRPPLGCCPVCRKTNTEAMALNRGYREMKAGKDTMHGKVQEA